MEGLNFEEFIKKWDNVKVLVAGDVMLDIYLRGKASRISPEAPVPVVKIESKTYVPGGAANVANNIKALKGKVYICGVVGEDNNGKNLCSELEKNGIGSLIVKNEKLPTITKTRIVAQNQQLLRCDIEQVVKSQPKDVEEQIYSNIKQVINDIDIIVLSDYNKGFFSTALSKKIVNLAKDNKKPVISDPKPENAFKFKHCTAMAPNHNEAERLTKIEYTKENLPKMGKALAQKLDLEWTIITCGEDGIFISDKGTNYKHIPAKAKEVYDVTGCGDTVMAALALSFGSGVEPFTAAYIANKAGGIAAGKIGTSTITREELIKSLNEKD